MCVHSWLWFVMRRVVLCVACWCDNVCVCVLSCACAYVGLRDCACCVYVCVSLFVTLVRFAFVVFSIQIANRNQLLRPLRIILHNIILPLLLLLLLLLRRILLRMFACTRINDVFLTCVYVLCCCAVLLMMRCALMHVLVFD